MADDELMDGGASAAIAFLMTDYVQGRTKRTVTAASALNELRTALEAVGARVAGKKPKESYEPRTRSRADKDTPEELTADVGDGTRIDAVQLIQELAVIVREIASAPSAAAAAKAKKSGGSLGESAPLAPGPLPDGPPNLLDPVLQPETPAEIGQARPTPTFGGDDGSAYRPEPSPVAALHAASTANAPVAQAAMIGPGRDAFANATFGGQMAEIGAAPVGAAFQGAPRAANAHALPAIIGQARAPLTSQGRVAGGAPEIKGPDRAAYAATREQYGGVTPIYASGLQPPDAPVAPIVDNIEPDLGDFRVIQLPEP